MAGVWLRSEAGWLVHQDICIYTDIALTQRLFHRVDDYARKLDVYNRGFSGYNTDWAIPAFEQVRVYRNRPRFHIF
jgi:hypothetical protein